MSKEVAIKQQALPGFQSAEGFELLQRQAKMFGTAAIPRRTKLW